MLSYCALCSSRGYVHILDSPLNCYSEFEILPAAVASFCHRFTRRQGWMFWLICCLHNPFRNAAEMEKLPPSYSLSLLDVGTECRLVEKSHCDQWWSRLETLHIIWDSSALRYILCCSLAIWWSVSHISLTMRYLIFHCPCGVCRVFDIPQFCFSLLFPCSSKFGYSIGALIPQQVRFFIRIYWGWGCFSPRRLAADYKWYATRTLSSGRKDPIKEQSAVPFEGILWWDGYLLNVLLLGDG